jgi:TetR/AcrR family transcriptional regulator, regulator of cefoperazone and chloramphenicol sensitivity
MSEGAAERKRPYDQTRRLEQAMQTRREITDAARRLFTARGWGETTVRDIAKEARVSEPTVYKSYGGKAGLAEALVDAVSLDADIPRVIKELEAAGDDRSAQLAAMVAFDRRLFERGGDVLRLIREAGRTEPKLAAAYRVGRDRGDSVRRATFSGWPGVDVDQASDTYAALCNVDVYFTLIEERGWSPDQVERWWHQSLVTLLVDTA